MSEPHEETPSTTQIVMIACGVLFLVVFPGLGLLVDAMADECKKQQCDANYQPLALPEAFGLVPLQIGAAFAFFLSVRRPSALSPNLEGTIVTLLFGGVVLHLALAVQFGPAIPYAL